MNYYMLMYNYNHSDSDEWMFLTFDENELPFGRYDVDESDLLPVDRVYCTIAEGQTASCDYIANNLVWLVVSEKVKMIMQDMNIGNCQFVEVIDKTTNSPVGYLVHCMDCYEALDKENSKYDTYSDGSLLIIKPAILSDRVYGRDIVKLQEDPMSYYVSEKLKKALQKNSAIGFSFMKIKS